MMVVDLLGKLSSLGTLSVQDRQRWYSCVFKALDVAFYSLVKSTSGFTYIRLRVLISMQVPFSLF